jgi:hypothetical protein
VKNIRFVQFPHPGEEHRPGPDGMGKAWNWMRNPPSPNKPEGSDNPHRRTFLQVEGIRLTEKGPVNGLLWSWAEWEAEAKVVRELHGSGREPTTLFEPHWLPKDSFENLHNTDPFIFGGFYYTDCKQGTSPSLAGMLTLDVGSVIVFGSGFKDGWVLDTVIVVRDHVDHNVANYESKLSNRIPDGYKEVVLGPTYSEHAISRNLPRRLYIGATYDDPLCGMFSFFPCAAPGNDKGFARPKIKPSLVLTQDRFNPNLRQGMKGHGGETNPLTLDQITKLWADIRDQVKASGCDLGVWAAMPQPLRNAD